MKGVPKIFRPHRRRQAPTQPAEPASLAPVPAGEAPVASKQAAESAQAQTPVATGSQPSKSGNQPSDSVIDGAKAIPAGDSVAVLAVGEAGEILSARESCSAVFGWEGSALSGQNIRVLLKGGLDNEVGRFLHQHRAGKIPAGTTELRVIALRKDGAEFPAMVTTLTWNWDTTPTQKPDASRLSWTAAFQKVAGGAESPGKEAPAQSAESQAGKLPAGEVKGAESIQQAGKQEHSESTGREHQDSAVVEKLKVDPTEHNAPLEQELASLRQERDELKSRMTSEQAAVAEFKTRVEELENQLRKAVGDLEGVTTDRKKQAPLEFELRSQLEAAEATVGYAEAALKEQIERNEKLEERLQNLSNSLRVEQAERSKRFEEELFTLRKERDELDTRLAAEQKAAADSTQQAEELESRIGRNAAEFERARAELEKQGERSESAWREQLDTAWVMKREIEGAWAGAVERNKRFEEELAGLRRERDELNARLAAEQQAATESRQRARDVENRLGRNATESDRAKAELAKQNAERECSEAEWREQLDAAKALRTRLEISLAEATGHSKRFEEELAALRQERDDLKERLTGEQQSAVAAKQRAEDLQSRLEQNTAELERVKADSEKQTPDRERTESKWREQQETAKALARKLEADWTAAVGRNVRLEEELASLRQERDELTVKLKARQQESSEPLRRAEDIERRLGQNAAELERAQAELEKQRAERETSEAEWREQLDTAKELAAKLEVAWTAAVERNRRFETELASLRQKQEELNGKLIIEQRAAVESRSQAEKLESHLNENAAELERVKADLENQNAEYERSESAWRNQLETAKAEKIETEETLAKATERNRRLETELAGSRRRHHKLNGEAAAEGQATAKTGQRPKEGEPPPSQSATDLDRVRAELEKAAHRLPAQVRQYDFEHPNGQPDRKARRPTKRRSQP